MPLGFAVDVEYLFCQRVCQRAHRQHKKRHGALAEQAPLKLTASGQIICNCRIAHRENDKDDVVKTNAVRILDNLGINYELRDYEVDPNDVSAEAVATKIGFPLEQVFKTLVARGDKNGVCLSVIGGNAQLDLKALAKVTGNRNVDVVPLKEVQPLTGYIRGGVTALACKKDYPVYVDENMYLFDVVSVSAGVRGTQILIAPDDYIKATRATVALISKPAE